MKKLTWGLVATSAVAVPLVLLARGAAAPDPGHGLDTVVVARRDLRTVVKATGVVKPMVGAEVRVGSRASGVVERLHVRIGDSVARGQILAELDDRELRARRDQTAAALSAARTQLAYADTDLRRKRDLSAARLIAEGELDLAERAFAVAEQQLAEAEANLSLVRTQLGYARIRAPISGVVGSVTTQEGETVSASLASPTFVTLLDLDRLEVWAYVDETDIGRVRVGLPATFTVDTYPDVEVAGRVTAIYPQPEIRDNVVNYVAVIELQPPPGGRVLRPEMTTTVQIAIESREDVLTVPRGAVRLGASSSFVYRAAGDAISKHPVITGARDEAYCEIVEGLREGDTVLVGHVDENALASR